MTFEKFSLLAKEHHLFSKKKRVIFAENDDLKNLKELQAIWEERKNIFIMRF